MFGRNPIADKLMKDFFESKKSDLFTFKSKVEEFDFDEFVNKYFKNSNVHYVDKDGYRYYEIDVPGFTKEDLSIEQKENVLTIKGSSKNFIDRKIDITLDVTNTEVEKVSLELGILSIKSKIISKEKVKKIIID